MPSRGRQYQNTMAVTTKITNPPIKLSIFFSPWGRARPSPVDLGRERQLNVHPHKQPKEHGIKKKDRERRQEARRKNGQGLGEYQGPPKDEEDDLGGDQEAVRREIHPRRELHDRPMAAQMDGDRRER